MPARIYQILQGVEVAATTTTQLLPLGDSGTRGARRRLVHPDTTQFPPVTYYLNPTRTFNFAVDYLRHPITSLQRTLSSSKLVRFEEVIEDVVVTEVWESVRGLSMPFFLFALLYEYVNNPPELNILDPQYIIWEPRDETTDTYKVEIVDFKVGGGSPGRFNMRRFRALGGPSGNGTIDTPSDNMDVPEQSFLEQPISLSFRIVEKVAV